MTSVPYITMQASTPKTWVQSAAAVAALMYYPFVRAYEKTLLQQDTDNAQVEDEDMSATPSQA